MKKSILTALTALGLASLQQGHAIDDEFNVNVTLLEFAELTMQDINIESIDASLANATNGYVSAATGVLIAESNSDSGYTVTVGAVDAADVVGSQGWYLNDTSGGEKMIFSLLANKSATGTSTPITETGYVTTAPTATELTEGDIVINNPTQDVTQKTWTLHAYIQPGEINKVSTGSYTTLMKMTLTANT